MWPMTVSLEVQVDGISEEVERAGLIANFHNQPVTLAVALPDCRG
jgi:hypothetical protein